jgi:predicted AAA+ superfamily ATPase
MRNNYFKRDIDSVLTVWAGTSGLNVNRKPLLLRGARQVGKTSAVQTLGASFKHYVEINFDSDAEVHGFFTQNLDPAELCSRLALYKGTPIVPGETLLFFDEIQSCIPAMKSLRYFYEQHPRQHLIAAGSLLEFALEEMPSFGVGRIHSVFMYPFSFYEFLGALGNGNLAEACRGAGPEKALPEPIHKQLIDRLKIFLLIGGMPESVASYVQSRDLLHSGAVLEDILTAFRDDFSKYRSKMPALILNEVFESVIHQAEGKFIYERAAVDAGNARVKQALDMLIKAGLAHTVTHSDANGIPLGAEINPKYRRIIPCDMGIFLHLLGIEKSDILLSENFTAVNRAALAEIFVGLELLKKSGTHTGHQLYCW